MASLIDSPLEDIIQQNREARRARGRGRRGGRGRGGNRRPRAQELRRRNAPYNTSPRATPYWQHDFRGTLADPAISRDTPRSSKILVENLDYKVDEADIEQLFSRLGALTDYAIHYDRSGRSLGVAEVTFARRLDAITAIEEYNGRFLDNKPMKVSFVSNPTEVLSSSLPVTQPRPYQGDSRRQGRDSRGGRSRGRSRGRGRGRGSARGGDRNKQEELPKSALDAQLELYQTGKVQVSSEDLDKQLQQFQEAPTDVDQLDDDGDAE